ncbi:MAG: hypothetical protein ACLVFD_09985 [Anaerostipes hadrus]
MNKSYIEYEYVNDQSENMQDVLNVQLNRLDAREKRIKEAYLAGVDSLDEYKKNKADIEKERELLYQQSNNQEEYKKNIDMPGKIRGVYDILNSDEYSKDEKYNAITSIVKKIVFDRENKTLDFYYYTR